MRNERNAHVKESVEHLVIGKKFKKKKNLFNSKQVLFNRAMKFVFFFFFLAE